MLKAESQIKISLSGFQLFAFSFPLEEGAA
jgi:hypothetical protein